MDTHVLIAGGGPVGLMLAGELARRSCPARIIELRQDRNDFVKALSLTPRTMEIFDLIGVMNAAQDRGASSEGICTVVNGEVVSRGVSRPDLWPYDFLNIAQPDTEAILEDRLREAGGLLERGRRLVSLVDHGDAVEAQIECENGGTEQVRCRWLVGCDGAHSTVRKQLGLPFEGEKFQFTFLVSDVELDWDRSHDFAWKIFQLIDGEIENMAAVIPIPGNERRYRVSAVIGVGDPADGPTFPEKPDLEFIREVLAPIMHGVAIDALRWSSIYAISHRIVPTYRQGNVLVAGDAAHIHPPIGGLGMNTGLQDAFNLGWKLSLLSEGIGGERLLDSYHYERHAVGEEVVKDTSRRMQNIIDQRDEDEQAELEAGTQLDVSYRGSTIVGPTVDRSALQPGDRLPSCKGVQRFGCNSPQPLIEQLRDGRFHLLAWAGRAAGSVDTLTRLDGALKDRLGDHADTVCIGAADAPPALHEPFPLFIDVQTTFAGQVGTEAVVLLVRPDGHLSWMGSWDDAGVDSLADHLAVLLT